MFLDILRKIPFVKSIVYFRLTCHRQAAPKFFVLWIFSSFPIIIAVLFANVNGLIGDQNNTGASDIADAVFEILNGMLSATEIYIYVASFLAPFLYIFYERYREAEVSDGKTFRDRRRFSMRHIFDGYWLLFIIAIIVLFVTACTFIAVKSGSETIRSTLIFLIASKLTIPFYLFSIYCLYLSLLDSLKEVEDFVGRQRVSEQSTLDGLHRRVNGSEG